ncbi:MAG: P-type conjugative transfer protein TrbJ [Sulfurospirillum cavolei]|nr:P-type conjugative transfer protein TrbJ [Sulfurospirillum cavolei]
MNGLNAISYDAGNVSSKFENTYKDYDGYSSELSSASNQAARNTAYSDRYKQITATNQNTLNGTMQKLQLSYEDLDSESSTIAALKKRSDDAEGNLQVLQATNDLLTYLIDEIRKLRVTTMDQTNAIANYLAAQNNEKILQQAKTEAFLNKDNVDNPFDTNEDMRSFSKLPGAKQ